MTHNFISLTQDCGFFLGATGSNGWAVHPNALGNSVEHHRSIWAEENNLVAFPEISQHPEDNSMWWEVYGGHVNSTFLELWAAPTGVVRQESRDEVSVSFPTVLKTPSFPSLYWTFIPIWQGLKCRRQTLWVWNPLTSWAHTRRGGFTWIGSSVQGHQPLILKGSHDHHKSKAHNALVDNTEPLNLCQREELSSWQSTPTQLHT